MTKKQIITLFTIALWAVSTVAIAQTSVSFNINLKPQLQDSTFVPGRDVAGVIGNLHPFQINTLIDLTDEEPIDSIYTVTIDFPSYQTGKSLRYNYILKIEDRDLRELRPRIIQLRKGSMILDALYFNAYAF